MIEIAYFEEDVEMYALFPLIRFDGDKYVPSERANRTLAEDDAKAANYLLRGWQAAKKRYTQREAEQPFVFSKSDMVTRYEDMSIDGFMRLFRQDDGDIIVSLFRGGRGGRAKMCDVEFCEPGSGGGRSSHTRKALMALMVAMEKDNEERPIVPPQQFRRTP